ncbi:MAG: hypothetical protein ACYDEY_07720 [Acidimicrobiales bacterium]
MTLQAWTAIGACATGVMAIATFLVVWQSRTLSGETKKLAEAARDSLGVSQALLRANQELVTASREQVAAAQEEARATSELAVEARNDRELACQPVVGIGPAPGAEAAFVREGLPLIVENIGGGPALGLRAFWWPDHEQTAWLRSASLHLAAGAGATISKEMFTSIQPLPRYEWFGHGDDPNRRESQGTLVFFWRDVLGFRYRLPVIRFPTTERPGVASTEVFDPRVAEPERRRPEVGVHDWHTDIRIFPTNA